MLELFWTWMIIFGGFFGFYWYYSVPSGLPPGSAGFPILGYMPFMKKKAYLTFAALSKKYGNLYYLYLGRQLVIILNDYRTMKQALVVQNEDFLGRPPIFTLDDDENFGVTSAEGDFWKQHRRFLNKTLNCLGISNSTHESLMLTEISHLMIEMRKSLGQPLPAKKLFMKSIINNIIIFVFGNRLDYEDPVLNKILIYLDEIFPYLPGVCLEMFCPWINWLPFGISEKILHKKKVSYYNNLLLKLISESISENKAEFLNGQRNCYVDAYLNEQKKRLENDSNDTFFSDVGLLHNARDLIGAGAETSAVMLLWIVLFMIRYPNIQKKIQKELDDVIGRHREPSWKDSINTPYTQATLCELNRIVSLSPFSVQRRPIKDTTLFGYKIPANAMVIPITYNIHHDPEIWENPKEFKPERFLTPDGKIMKLEHLVPFSIGKRCCPGAQFARKELYLYFTSLLLNFDFFSPNGKQLSFKCNLGITRQPKSDVICFRER